MTIPASLLPHLSLLLFLIISAATAAFPPAPAPASAATAAFPPAPAPADTGVIQESCQLTDYYDLCVSSLLSRPGSSNASFYDLGKLSCESLFDGAKDAGKLLSKLMRGYLDPASKLVLRECGKPYDKAIDILASADRYMNSDAFKHFHKPGLHSAYDSVLNSVYYAQEEITKCGEMLKNQRGLVEPFKQKTEIVRRLAVIAQEIIIIIIV